MWILLIGLIIFLVGLFLLGIKRENAAFIFGVVGAYLISGGIIMLGINRRPTAMDVYQGKTILQITYKDSIPVDSIVVFKDKEK